MLCHVCKFTFAIKTKTDFIPHSLVLRTASTFGLNSTRWMLFNSRYVCFINLAIHKLKGHLLIWRAGRYFTQGITQISLKHSNFHVTVLDHCSQILQRIANRSQPFQGLNRWPNRQGLYSSLSFQILDCWWNHTGLHQRLPDQYSKFIPF